MRRKAYSFAMRGLMALSVAITCGFALFIILYVLCKGLPNITWQLLSTSPSILNDRIGILPDILNTLYLILAALAVRAAPGGGSGCVPDRIRVQQKAGVRHRVRRRDPLGHTFHHLRLRGHDAFCRGPSAPPCWQGR